MTSDHELTELVDAEAEQWTLSAVLRKPEVYDEISTIVTENDFYYRSNFIILASIRYLYNRNIYDLPTLIKLLEQKGKLEEVGGRDYIIKLKDSAPTLNLVKFYAERVKAFSVYRQGLKLANDIKYLTENADKRNVSEYVAKVHQRMQLFNAVEKNNLSNIKNVIPGQVSSIKSKEKVESPLTSFKKIDEWMFGIGRDRLIVIAGRPGTGKTGLSLRILRSVSKQKFGPPVMFSMEMSKEELLTRMLADQSGVNFSMIMRRDLSDDQVDRVEEASKEISKYDFYIDDTAKMDFSYIASQCRYLKREHGQLGVVLIDYLGLLMLNQGPNESKSDAIGRITSSGKQLARELGCSVVFLQQMNRDIEKRQVKRPVMSDLRDSGSIEQDADMIIFLYRDEEKSKEHEAHIDFIVAKGRQTGMDDFELTFNGAIQRFGEK